MVNEMKQKWFLIILALLLACFAVGCSDTATPDQSKDPGEDTKVGPIDPTTGNEAPMDAFLPGEVSSKQYKEKPKMQIDVNKTYLAHVNTSLGPFTIELFAKDAPVTVNNFVFLAKEGFYKNHLFFRVFNDFVIQTGDPLGDGSGGPGYEFEDELNNGHTYDIGVVAMANNGPNTNGSQFFIGSGPEVRELNKDPKYTIFGKVIKGMLTIERIARVPVTENPFGEPSMPIQPVWIKEIIIEEK